MGKQVVVLVWGCHRTFSSADASCPLGPTNRHQDERDVNVVTTLVHESSRCGGGRVRCHLFRSGGVRRVQRPGRCRHDRVYPPGRPRRLRRVPCRGPRRVGPVYPGRGNIRGRQPDQQSRRHPVPGAVDQGGDRGDRVLRLHEPRTEAGAGGEGSVQLSDARGRRRVAGGLCHGRSQRHRVERPSVGHRAAPGHPAGVPCGAGLARLCAGVPVGGGGRHPGCRRALLRGRARCSVLGFPGGPLHFHNASRVARRPRGPGLCGARELRQYGQRHL